MLVLVTATDWEMSMISGTIRWKDEIRAASLRLRKGVYKGKDILLARTGMGKDCAEQAVNYIAANYQIECLISFGVAGGLRPELRTGDIVICEVARCADTGPDNSAFTMNSSLVDRACRTLSDCGLTWHRGIGVTVHNAATGVKEKQHLRKTAQVDICEMEDYWIARAAAARHVPCLPVRVIFDEDKYSLPPMKSVVDVNGKLRPVCAVAYFLAHPALLLKIPGLYRRSRIASRSLRIAAARILNEAVEEAG